jgi:hypothetical protein
MRLRLQNVGEELIHLSALSLDPSGLVKFGDRLGTFVEQYRIYAHILYLRNDFIRFSGYRPCGANLFHEVTSKTEYNSPSIASGQSQIH